MYRLSSSAIPNFQAVLRPARVDVRFRGVTPPEPPGQEQAENSSKQKATAEPWWKKPIGNIKGLVTERLEGIQNLTLEGRSAWMHELDPSTIEGLTAADPLIEILKQLTKAPEEMPVIFKDPAEAKKLRNDLLLYLYMQAPGQRLPLLMKEMLHSSDAQKLICKRLPEPFVKALGEENCAKLVRVVIDNHEKYMALLDNNPGSLLVIWNTLSQDEQLKEIFTDKDFCSRFQQEIKNFLDSPRFTEILRNSRELLSNPKSALEKLTAEGKDGIFLNVLQEQALQTMMIHFICNVAVGPGKIGQMLANADNLPKEVEKVLAPLLSRNVPTRTMEQAQERVDKLFGAGKYRLTGNKPIRVATVGEVYSAVRTEDDKPVIIKMIKDGITQQALELEWTIIERFMKAIYQDARQRDFKLNQLQTLYRLIIDELNYMHEADGAQELARDAKRYGVAGILEVATSPINKRQGVAMVMEWAPGVELADLIDMVKFHNSNPQGYAEKYADEIERHPWLAKPEVWKDQIAEVYLRAYTEQVFLRQNWDGWFRPNRKLGIHGDPHPGNVFIDFDTRTVKLFPTYIDTGLTIKRDTALLLKNAGMVLDHVLGNSKGMASRLVGMADSLPKDKSREQVTKDLAKELHHILYEKPINLQNPKAVGNVLEALLQKHEILLQSEQQGFLKAQLQTMMTYRKISSVTGQGKNSFINATLSDILWGLGLSILSHPIEAMKVILPGVKHIFRNWRTALRTAMQFMTKPSEKAPTQPRSEVAIA